MKSARSLREVTRLLDTDLRLRKLCLIKPGEAGYPRSVLSRFIRKVGEDNLTKIIEEKVVPLTPAAIHQLVHDLYVKAGLVPAKPFGRLYDLRAHSIRKFFRTRWQLWASKPTTSSI
jgi:hypothetical protein